MNLPMSAPLPTAQPTVAALPQKTAADYPTKFEDIAPGSRVLIGGQGVPEPFEAIVLATMAEYGATAIPAIQIAAIPGNEQFIITASGMYTVTVLVNGRDLAASLPAPANAIQVRTRPRSGVAICFRGGIESATEIISWAIGTGTFHYDGGNDQVDEHLQQNGVNGAPVFPGDWVLKIDGGFVVVPGKVFATEYEEI